MKKYTLELKYDIEEHVPIVVSASGNDMEELLANAEYTVDVPDPKHFHSIDNLTVRSYNKVITLIEEHLREQNERAVEARSGAQ